MNTEMADKSKTLGREIERAAAVYEELHDLSNGDISKLSKEQQKAFNKASNDIDRLVKEKNAIDEKIKERTKKTSTPESETAKDKINTTDGGPSSEEQDNARRTGETKETKAHQEQMDKPKEVKRSSSKEVAGPQQSPTGNKDINREIAKKRAKKLGGALGEIMPKSTFGKVVMATAAPFAINGYVNDAKENGVVPATIKAGATLAMTSITNPALIVGGIAAAKTVNTLIDAALYADNQARAYARYGTANPFQNTNFVDTRQTFTMRQAAMSAMEQQRGNLENYMLGNEASFLQ